MVALTQTPANVDGYSDLTSEYVQGGEAISPGMPVELNVNGKYYKAANTGLAEAAAKGIAVSACTADTKYFFIGKTGSMNIGATLAVGENYCVGASGAIIPEADLTTGNFPTDLGRAETASKLVLAIKALGVAHA